MNYSTIFIIFVTSIWFVAAEKKLVQTTRFRAVSCQSDNATVVLRYCNLKAISRDKVFLNFGGTIIGKLQKPIQIQLIHYYRFGNIYREVINTQKIEFCSVMDGANSHLFLKQMMEQIKEIATELIHKCPYKGDIDVRNLTTDDSKYFDVFPAGMYRLELYVFKGETEVFKLQVDVQHNSPMKESFGK